MKTFREKRKHRRVPIEDVTVEIYDSTDQAEAIEICSILNLSQSGMLFETGNTYSVSQEVRLTFVLPNSIVIVRTDAIVRHRSRNGRWDYVGVQFRKLSVPERKGIEMFVKAHGTSEQD